MTPPCPRVQQKGDKPFIGSDLDAREIQQADRIADQQAVDTMTVSQAQAFIDAGHFGAGSMLPKVQAAMQVVNEKPSCVALITSLVKLTDGLEAKTGTRITSN